MKKNIKQNQINYRKRHPLRVKATYIVCSAKKKNVDFTDRNGIEKWLSEQDGRCYYCGNILKGGRDFQVDRKIPSFGYVEGNIVLACFNCNRLKSDIFTDKEWLEIVKKYKISDRY